MIPLLTYVAMGLAGAFTLFAVVEFLRRRPMGKVLFYGSFGLTGVAILVILVSIVEMILGHEPGDLIIYIGYALTALLTMPVVFVWASLNRNRFGTLTLGIGALVLLVLLMRMLQVWNGHTL